MVPGATPIRYQESGPYFREPAPRGHLSDYPGGLNGSTQHSARTHIDPLNPQHLSETGPFGSCPLNRQLTLRRASVFQEPGTPENPGSCAESMRENRNVFINGGETRGLGRGE